MIEERFEEQAALYVLGMLEGEELLEFEKVVKDDEARRLITQLRETSGFIAADAPVIAPPASLKARIMGSLPRAETTPVAAPASKIISFPQQMAASWFPWSLAAALAVLATISFLQKNSAETETANLQVRATELETTVERLESKDRFSEMRIAVLNSLLENSPKAVAVSVWDKDQQNGVLVVDNLAPLPPDRDYQLWVVDPGYENPVDAGVFQVDEKGKVRFEFKPKLPIKNFQKVAVSQEKKGGVPKAEGTMVLLGS